jgi:hypothetical protein
MEEHPSSSTGPTICRRNDPSAVLIEGMTGSIKELYTEISSRIEF